MITEGWVYEDDYYDGMNPFELAAQWGLEGKEDDDVRHR